MPITLLDGILVFVMLISAVLAMIRGFTREVFSIASWVIAALAAWKGSPYLLPYVQAHISDEKIAHGLTIAGIFFITLVVVSIITMRISDFILDSKAGPLDRTLGFLFGAARGLILVVVAFLFLNFFIAEDRQPAWIANAKSRPWLNELGNELMAKLPENAEAELERLRSGEEPDQAAPPPAEDTDTPADAPGIAPEDQNALDRELETPPAP